MRFSTASATVAVGLLASAAYFIFQIVVGTFEYLAFLRDRAQRYRAPSRDWPYPTASVVEHSVLILVEAFILWVALTQPRIALWRRALACFLVALLTTLSISASGSLHWPPAVELHALWLLYITAGLLVTTTVAVMARPSER